MKVYRPYSLRYLFLLTLLLPFDIYSQTFPSFFGAKVTTASITAVPQDYGFQCSADINNDGNLDLIGRDGSYVGVFYLDGAGSFIGDTTYLISLNSVAGCDTADLNSDGFEDIVGISNGSWTPAHEIFVMMSDSIGRFTVTFHGNTGTSSANTFTLNDFNNDGFTDAAIALGNFSPNLAVMYGNSTFTFNAPIVINTSAGGTMSYITSGDLNNDSLADIAVSMTSGSSYTVLLADTTPGVFQITNYSTGTPVQGIKAIDLNLDGFKDLVMAADGSTADNGIKIILGFGTGNFPHSSALYYSTGYYNSHGAVYTPDINNDGYPDVVIPFDGSAHNTFLNSGDPLGTMFYAQRAEAGAGAVYGDFSNDGLTDMYSVTNVGLRRYVYAFGNGDSLLPLAPRCFQDERGFVKAADFNNDGFGDVVAYNVQNGNITVNLGSANGLSPAWSTNHPHGSTLTINYFNNDSFPDIVFYVTTSSLVYMYPGVGNGTFGQLDSFPVTGLPITSSPMSWVTSGDMNEDGTNDIVYGYGNNFSNVCEYGILFGDGSGGFSAPQTASVNGNDGFENIEVGLLNTDNRLDIVIHHNAARFCVLYGTGGGTYAPSQLFNTPELWCEQIIIIHMDYDAFPDIVFATGDDLDVHYGNSSGTFTTPTSYGSCDGVVACIDINGDWLTDIVAIDLGVGGILVRVGDGNRNFPYPDTLYVCEVWENCVCVTDVDNDGKLDVVDNGMAWFRNVTPGIIITDASTQVPTISETGISLYPNPTIDQTTLILNSTSDGTAQIIIYAFDGRMVSSQTVPVSSGENRIPIEVYGMSAGIYTLQTVREGISEEQKLVVR